VTGKPAGARVALAVLVAGGSVALIALTPALAGISWVGVGRNLLTTDPEWLLAVAGVWCAVLLAHSLVVTASLPGLAARRAVGLNLAGSAVANSVPLGGAISLGLTTAMLRSWGFTPRAVTASLTLTNVANLTGRLVFGSAAVAWILHAHPRFGGGAPALAVVAAASTVLLLAAVVAASDAATRALGRAWSWAARRADGVEALLSVRRQVLGLCRTSWPRLTLGTAANLVLLGLLLDFCLRGLDVPAALPEVVATVGVERLVTALPITPGGAGAAELSLLACLTAMGVPAVDALPAALLYRFFTFFAEIPLGALVTLGWHLGRLRGAARYQRHRVGAA
jgi:uncharacterized membrane protein YbhN (UPF0104 family)